MRVQHRPSEAEGGPHAPPAPRFSIVIPLFNKERYVRAALGSVLAQTLADFEVVIVDDGSADDGVRVAASFGDPRVRIVRQPNAGVSIARNRGIALARGEWVVFLDADDWQHPAFLAGLAAVQQAHPDVDFVATRFVEFDDQDGQPPPPWGLPGVLPAIERIDDLAARWMKGATLFTGSVAVRRRVLVGLQPCFRPGEHFGEDLELWFRLSERTPIALADVPLAGYRKAVAGSLSRVHDGSLPAWVDRLRERALAPGYDPVRRRSALALIGQFHVSHAREALAAGRRRSAWASLGRAGGAMRSPRWWLTAFMTVWPAALVQRYLRGAPATAPAQGHCEPTLDMADLMDWAAAKAQALPTMHAARTP